MRCVHGIQHDVTVADTKEIIPAAHWLEVLYAESSSVNLRQPVAALLFEKREVSGDAVLQLSPSVSKSLPGLCMPRIIRQKFLERGFSFGEASHANVLLGKQECNM